VKINFQACASALLKVFVFGLAVLIAGVALMGLFDFESQSPVFQSLLSTISWAGYTHIIAGSFALILGGVQLSSNLRRRNLELHKLTGKLYVICVLASSLGAMVSLPYSPSGWGVKSGLWFLAILWPLVTIAGYPRGGKFNFQWHGQLMIYSYSLTCVAISLRVLIGLQTASGVGIAIAYPVAAWGGIVVNLIVAFVALQVAGNYKRSQ
jgi:hypothetical protein